MRIKLVSDLHLEIEDINIKNEEGCDVLILSGDIMVAADLHDHPEPATPYTPEILKILGNRQLGAQRYRDFLKRVSFQFPQVIIICGNHEFYHGKWYATIDYMRSECSKYSNIHFLECDSIVIKSVMFVGGTLWTDMNKFDPLTLHHIKNAMNDYRMIRNDRAGYIPLKPADTVYRHRETLKYFAQIIDNSPADQPVVVVAHHAPSNSSIDLRYKPDYLTNGAYASDLSEFILDRPKIKLFCHGHTHHPFDYMIGSTRVVCNPRGYDGYEDTGWDPNKIIEI